jgi:hypothetical protein
MDELEISGRRYISSRQAAKEHKYHADYIGQLVRGGKVAGQKVGRAWYVDALSLAEYLGKEVPARGPLKVHEPTVAEMTPVNTIVPKEEVPQVVIEKKKQTPVVEEEVEFALPIRKSGRAHTIAALDQTTKAKPAPVYKEYVQPIVEEPIEISAPQEVYKEESTDTAEIFKVDNETFIPVKITTEEKQTHYSEPEDSFYKVSRKGLRYVSEATPLVPRLTKKSTERFTQEPIAGSRSRATGGKSGARAMQAISAVLVAGILSLGVGVLLSYYLHSTTTVVEKGQTSSLVLSE